MTTLSWLSTRFASAASAVTTESPPTRSPYRLNDFENDVATRKLRPASMTLPTGASPTTPSPIAMAMGA